MKKAAFITKAILFPLILLAGVVGLVLFCRASLRFPHLHLALSEIRLKTLCFLAAGLLCAAFAVVAAEYILFNFKEAYWKLLIPAAGALVLLAVCGLCFRQALRPLAYTYTEALSDYEADFDASRFQTPEEQLFPDPVTGTVTGYRLYRDGPREAEIVTVTYELAPFYTEQRRIQRMGLSGFKLDEERYCYELPTEDCLYQVDLNDETHQIFYRRFVQVDSLPAYAPHPETEPEEPDARPGLVTDYAANFDAAQFMAGSKRLFPATLTGDITDYLLYRSGETVAERITVSYTLNDYYSEVNRIKRLHLSSFSPSKKHTCYELTFDGLLYQIEIDDQNQRVQYSRFFRPEALPYYAPHPTTATAGNPTTPAPEDDTSSESGQTLPSLPGVH